MPAIRQVLVAIKKPDARSLARCQKRPEALVVEPAELRTHVANRGRGMHFFGQPSIEMEL